MGLIKEPVAIDFTVVSKIWTVDEEKEFSELIRKQKEKLGKQQNPLLQKQRIDYAQYQRD